MKHFDSYDVSRDNDTWMNDIESHIPKGAPPVLPMEATDEVVRYYSPMVYRIAMTKTQSSYDADDIFQEVFMKLCMNTKPFDSEEHRKAWLIKVCANISKNILMFRLRRETINIDDIESICIAKQDFAVFEHIMSLPAKYKIVMTLYYVEGYRCKEISEIIDVNEDAVRKRLQKGRELLKIELEKGELK